MNPCQMWQVRKFAIREVIAKLATKEHKELKEPKIKVFSLCSMRSFVAILASWQDRDCPLKKR